MKSHDEMAAERVATLLQVRTVRLEPAAAIPNSRLPLLVYHGAVRLDPTDPARTIEDLFAANRWTGSWRNGIYTYHHYHSTAHEVLGVFCGSVTVQFGGEHGLRQKIAAGDVVVIPAGVAHKNLGASSDFGVVGAYAGGRSWDMNYGRPEERLAADRNIAAVPAPECDPVFGPGGPLLKHWLEAERF